MVQFDTRRFNLVPYTIQRQPVRPRRERQFFPRRGACPAGQLAKAPSAAGIIAPTGSNNTGGACSGTWTRGRRRECASSAIGVLEKVSGVFNGSFPRQELSKRLYDRMDRQRRRRPDANPRFDYQGDRDIVRAEDQRYGNRRADDAV